MYFYYDYFNIFPRKPLQILICEGSMMCWNLSFKIWKNTSSYMSIIIIVQILVLQFYTKQTNYTHVTKRDQNAALRISPAATCEYMYAMNAHTDSHLDQYIISSAPTMWSNWKWFCCHVWCNVKCHQLNKWWKMHIHVKGIEHPENNTHRSRLVFLLAMYWPPW